METHAQRKHGHKGKGKASHSKLKAQLEFYFSDSNLWKDKFLRQEIAKSPERYVSLSVIAAFKRVKELTNNDLGPIVQVIRESNKLELSENGTQVRRVTPMAPERNMDDYTVYVEQMPADIDHDRLRNAFSVFGGVTYVSLPRYKPSRLIKGFAFVEFDSVDAAKRAAEAFSEEKVVSEGSGDEAESARQKPERRDQEETESTGHSGKESRKRKREPSEEESTAESSRPTTGSGPSKKRKHKDLDGDDENGEPPCKRQSSPSPEKTEKEDAKQAGAGNIEEQTEGKSKKKKRTRSHTKSKRKRVKAAFGDWKPSVLLKSDWEERKREYKKLQQAYMSQLKQQMKDLRKTEKDTTVPTPKEATRPGMKYKPAVVVKFSWTAGTDTSHWTALALKQEFSKHGRVAFVDFASKDLHGYVRFNDVTDCQKALTSLIQSSEESKMAKVDQSADAKPSTTPTAFCLLQGDEEMAFWKRAEQDHEKKYSETDKQGKHREREKKRGRGKLLQKALKIQLGTEPGHQHLHFDADEAEDAPKAKKSKGSHHIVFDSDDDEGSQSDRWHHCYVHMLTDADFFF